MKVRNQPPAAWRCIMALLLGLIWGARGRRFLFRKLLGYQIHPTAFIGHSFVRVMSLEMGPRSKLGHLTIIRNVRRVVLEEQSRIGTFNWIFGMLESDKHFLEESERAPEFIMKPHSSITSRHIVDCTDSVQIGAFSTVAGFNTQILTHGIDVTNSRQSSAPVRIGDHCLLGTNCIILKGSVLPNRTILAAGSVFRGAPAEEGALFSGLPATAVRTLPHESRYFSRAIGPID
ncbi:MAG: hypothetical protein Q8R82_01295 [Hyphomonadaceae bacterium]|nr:hypothetical protein [Hyphomonadaceae bacterium]